MLFRRLKRNIKRNVTVLLLGLTGSSDHINAVFTDGYKHRDAYIITQAPLPATVADLWAMIYDHECTAIVMMNELDLSDPVSHVTILRQFILVLYSQSRS